MWHSPSFNFLVLLWTETLTWGITKNIYHAKEGTYAMELQRYSKRKWRTNRLWRGFSSIHKQLEAISTISKATVLGYWRSGIIRKEWVLENIIYSFFPGIWVPIKNNNGRSLQSRPRYHDIASINKFPLRASHGVMICSHRSVACGDAPTPAIRSQQNKPRRDHSHRHQKGKPWQGPTTPMMFDFQVCYPSNINAVQ